MVTTNQQPEPAFAGWEDAEQAPRAEEALIVSLDGFEGPLDLLLALARTQKVDLAKISVLALAEQYLAFVSQALKARLELAADYLVMAAWLAFLKSKLLLPREEGTEQPSGDELAARLAFRLMRLEAMRNAGAQLMTRKRLGRDVFPRGSPEGVRTIRVRKYTAMIFDLLKAYADQRKRTVKRVHVVPRRVVWSIKEARQRLEALLGDKVDDAWVQLDAFLEKYGAQPAIARTARASSFSATLEMARDGMVELSQAEPFAPIYMRKREPDAVWQRIT